MSEIIEIEVGYKDCKFKEKPSDELISLIRYELRYKVEGAKFIKPRWGKGKKGFIPPIDEYKYLYDKRSKSFPTGLLQKVEKILTENFYTYKLIEKRVDKPVKDPLLLQKKSLRDYQVDAEEKALKAKNCIIKIPTGGGKTLIFTSMIGKLNGYTSIILVRRQLLLMQTIEEIQENLGIEVGQIGVGIVDIKPVTVAMIQTVAKALDPKHKISFSSDDEVDEVNDELTEDNIQQIRSFLPTADCLIADECHGIPAETAQLVINHIENARHRYGFCVAGNTLVLTKEGEKQISELSVGEEIQCYNIEQQQVETTIVKFITHRPLQEKEEVYRLKLNEKKELIVTASHPVWTQRGYIEVKDLDEKQDYIYDYENKRINFTKELIPFNEEVWDIGVESENHNFFANNVLIHNSATPWRSDGKDILIEALTGPKVVDITASQLIEQNYLVPPHIYFLKTPPVLVPRERQGGYQEVYKKFIVENEERNQLIFNTAKTAYEKFEHILILVNQIDHGMILLEKLEKAGIWAEYVHGADSLSKRIDAMNRFTSKTRSVLLGSAILNEGINIPEITTLINAAGLRSSAVYYQKIGRAIRLCEGKKRAIIVDFLDESIKYMDKQAKERLRILKTEPLYKISIQGEKKKDDK